MTDKATVRAARSIILACLFAVFMLAYFRGAMPGYFHSLSLCSGGCHDAKVLHYTNITHPFWCLGCHGFGVKSNLIPWLNIPLYRDHRLELMVEEHGECLMCHPVPDEFHWKHLEANTTALERVGLYRPIQCTDCHVGAYHGRHTVTPGNKVCIKCHDAAKIHGSMVKTLRADCLACHGGKPLVPASYFKPKANSYNGVASAVEMLLAQIGATYAPSDPCLACHSTPANPGHEKHYGALYKNHNITCVDCHKSPMPHGWEPPVTQCRDCHKLDRIPFHEKEETLLYDCYRCHRGFKHANATLTPPPGCKTCHGETYIEIADVGLHAVHIRAYSYNCTVCHDAKAKTHERFITSANTTKLCKRCHNDYGALKPEAVRGLAPSVGFVTGVGFEHAVFVERSRGNCFACHTGWLVPLKPKLLYVYPPSKGR